MKVISLGKDDRFRVVVIFMRAAKDLDCGVSGATRLQELNRLVAQLSLVVVAPVLHLLYRLHGGIYAFSHSRHYSF